MLRHRVCIITVYFGEIPDFFSPFLESCSWNEDFDFLIVHDQKIPYKIPPNVFELTMSINEFKQKLNEKLEIEICNLRPYKVCDLRPAFGYLFQEQLRSYDFWGICDSDLIFGRLSDFITDNMLDHFDKLFTYGHLSLVRNDDRCRMLFLKDTENSRSFIKIAKQESNGIYDEERGFNEKFLDEGYPFYTKRICADGSIVRKRFMINTRSTHLIAQPGNPFWKECEKRNYRYQAFCIDRGKTYKIYRTGWLKNVFKQEEYAYIHKLEFKTVKPLTKASRLIVTPEGYVTDVDFFDRIDNGNVSAKVVADFCPPQTIYELFHTIYWDLRTIWRQTKRFIRERAGYER